MTRARHPSDKAADGSGADGLARLRPASRRMLTRMLPGGVMVAAALTMPEFSVGAGDMGRGPQPAAPPEPAGRADPSRVQRLAASAAQPDPRLAGVRYAPVIDLGTDPVHAAGPARVQAARPGGVRQGKAVEAAPDHAVAFAQAFADPALAAAPVAGPAAPLAAPAGSAPAIAPPSAAVIPQIAPALAAAASVAASVATPADPQAAPELPPELPEAPSKPVAAEADAMAFANLLPEEQTALRAPGGTGAVPISQTVTQPVSQPASRPAPVPAAVAAPVPAPARAAALAPASGQPAPRGMIDQVTPVGIAPARAASAPATAPARVAPLPAPKAATLAAAPGARAPVAAAPVAAAAKLAPPPAAAAAAIAPRQAPALAAPPSAAPRIADLDFKSRLLTRVDGRTRGEVDFQQTAAGLKVRLGSVAEVLADRLPAGELARIRSSSSGNAWLSLAELQAQGIPISYDPVYDEFNIGREDTRPKDARKVHIDQISTPERVSRGSAGPATMDQIRPR